MTFPDWDRRLLVALGIEPTGPRLTFLRAWAACEGGTASFNPLNTSYIVHGATDYNGVGVKRYPNEIVGLAATMLTIQLVPYRELLAALHAPGLTPVGIVDRSGSALHTWGTGTVCIRARLGGHSTRT